MGIIFEILLMIGVIGFVVFFITRRKKEAKQEEERIKQEKLEFQRKSEDALRKAKLANAKTKTCKKGDDFYYDEKYRSCYTSDAFAKFWKEFYGDKEFWHGDFNTVFLPRGDHIVTVGKNGGHCFSEELEKFGYNKNNPFVSIVIRFLECRQSSKEKIDYNNWVYLHNWVEKTGLENDEASIMLKKKFKNYDYKIFMLPRYDFEKELALL